MPPCSRRRGARPPLFRGGGSLYRRARCVVLGSSRSLRVALGAVAVARRSRRRCPRRCASAPRAGSIVPPRSRRRDARPPLVYGGGSLSQCARCVVLSSSRSLRVALGAVAVARRSRRRCLRRCAGAPCAGSIVPPRSRRRDARPPLVGGGISLSRHARFLGPYWGLCRRRLALSACGQWRSRFLSGGGRRRAALTAPLPAALRWRSWRRLGRAAALAAA